MESLKVAFASLVLVLGANLSAAEGPARSAICKSTRAAALKQSDKSLLVPDRELSEQEEEVVTAQRSCVKSYGIGYPGGVDGMVNASAAAFKIDLDQLTALFATEKTRIVSAVEWDALAAELATQRGADNITLSQRNRETMRIKEIRDGMDREQMLLWGHHLYLRKLYQEESYQKLIEEAEALRGKFSMTVAPHRWDVAERHTYFSVQSLKNMIAVLIFKARAQLAKGDATAGRILLEKFVKIRPAVVPAFESMGGDPTGEIRTPYCTAKI